MKLWENSQTALKSEGCNAIAKTTVLVKSVKYRVP